MFKGLKWLFIALIIIVISACAGDQEEQLVLKQEKNQVWSVNQVDGEFAKDKITFLETYEYDKEGREVGHLIYDPEGNLAGKELSVFDDSQENPIGSRYYSATDSLLSYYQLDYDGAYKSKRKGFDASNDELLRVEVFQHDKDGNMTRKEVRNSSEDLISAYDFTYDENGNMTYMVSRDAGGNIRFSEEYRITLVDDQKKWLENWGWREDSPVSYRKRELIYYK